MIPGDSIPVIDGFFNITYIRNTGGAFSLLSGRLFILIAITLVLMAVIVAVAIKFSGKISFKKKLAFTLILAGGLGNLIDRMIMGYVTDFIDIWKWPVFNIADIAITCGCMLMIIFVLREDGGGFSGERHKL